MLSHLWMQGKICILVVIKLIEKLTGFKYGGFKMLYRIVTEDKNTGKTLQLVSDHFKDFTVINSIGYWNGVLEYVKIIEISTDVPEAGYRIGVLAKLIKVQNKQDAVLVQEIPCKSSLV